MNDLHRILDISIELTQLGLNKEAESVLKILNDKILKNNSATLNGTRIDLSSFPRDLGKVQAIKLLRTQTGCSLIEAREFVEEHNIFDPEAGSFVHLDLIHSAHKYAKANGFSL